MARKKVSVKMKECYYCKEHIQENAEKCRFCHEFQPAKRKLLEELLRNWKNQSEIEILMWILIWALASFVSFIISQSIFQNIYVSLLVVFIVSFIILSGRFYNMQSKAFLTIFTICIAIANLYQQNNSLKTQIIQSQQQSISLKTQIEQFQLDKRPYLFVNFERVFAPRDKDTLFGAIMIFQNKGRSPADIIKTDYLVCDDISQIGYDYEKWYRDTYGGFPEVKIVPPDNSIDISVHSPGIVKNANFASVGVLVIYKGLEPNAVHWFKRQEVFRIIKDENGVIKDKKLIDIVMEWDQNRIDLRPKLKQPNWGKYKKLSQ